MALVTVAFPADSVSVPVPEYVATVSVPVALSFFKVADAPERVVTVTLPVDALLMVAPDPDCVPMVKALEPEFFIVPVALEAVTVMSYAVPVSSNVPAPVRDATVRAAPLDAILMVPAVALTAVGLAFRLETVITPVPVLVKVDAAVALVTVAFPADSVSVPVPEYVPTVMVFVPLPLERVADAAESVVTLTAPDDALFMVTPDP